MPRSSCLISKGDSNDGSVENRPMKFFSTSCTATMAHLGLPLNPSRALSTRCTHGRVNDMYRVSSIQVQGSPDSHYVFTGVWPHDEAHLIAETARLQVTLSTAQPRCFWPRPPLVHMSTCHPPVDAFPEREDTTVCGVSRFLNQ